MNLNSVENGPVAGVDQNRLFVGPNYLVLPVLQIEAGYMWNYIWRPAADRVNHNVVLWLSLTLP